LSVKKEGRGKRKKIASSDGVPRGRDRPRKGGESELSFSGKKPDWKKSLLKNVGGEKK